MPIQNAKIHISSTLLRHSDVGVCGKDGNEIEVVGNTHTKKQ